MARENILLICRKCGRALTLCLALPCLAFAGNEANPDAIELAPLPMPVEFKSDIDNPVPFDASTTVVVECPDEAGAAWLAAHFVDYQVPPAWWPDK